jgi:hypothetical protein
MKFTKTQQEFIDWIDAVVESELDLETTVHMKKLDWPQLVKDFDYARKTKKDFFNWFQLLIKNYQKKK